MAALCLVALQACKEEENAPAVIGTGTCGAQGDNLTWTLDENGTLTIKGEGAMEDYDYFGKNPSWGIYHPKILAVVIQDGVTNIGDVAFSEEYQNLASVTINSNLTSIGTDAFWECENLKTLTIHGSVKSIEEGAFLLCGLTSITFPDGLISIGEWAFSDCTSLTTITLPEGLTNIESNVFFNCTSLASITLSSSLTNIGDKAFFGCTSLTTITIPQNVTSIGEWAFSGCTSLSSITVEAVVPPFIALDDETTEFDNEAAFGGVNPSIPVYVPSSSVDDYRNSAWGQYFNNIQPM